MGATQKNQRVFSNTTIVWINAGAVALLLMCCVVFIISNLKMFKSDFTSYMVFFPILFFIGVALIIAYAVLLVVKLDGNKTAHADRFDIPYRIIFTVTLLMMLVRSFLGDFNGEGTILNVQIQVIIPAIISGLITWITPKIKDNDNSDF